MKHKYKSYILVIIVVILIITCFFIFQKLMVKTSARNINYNIHQQADKIKEIEKTNDVSLHQSANFEIIIEDINNIESSDEKVYGFISPHHLLANSIINNIFAKTQDNKIEEIILLSPNHFQQGDHKVLTSINDWQTKNGIVKSNKKLNSLLVSKNYAQNDPQSLEKEHGIFNLIPYIQYYYPKATILPLVISDDLKEEELQNLNIILNKNLSNNALYIVSADFTHYLDTNISLLHDQTSIATLNNHDYDNIEKIDIDNPNSLRLLFKYLTSKVAYEFNFVENNISHRLTNTTGPQDGTSYVSGYFTRGVSQEYKQATMMFFGDLMLDRDVYLQAKKTNDFELHFANLARFLKGINLTVVNLEGPITNYPSQSINDNSTRFTFSPEYLDSLAKYFDVFNLANNHTRDFGKTGFEQTQNYLNEKDLVSFGETANQGNLSDIVEVNGLKIAFVGYNDLINPDPKKIVQVIKSLKTRTDFIVIYTHWDREYHEEPMQATRDKAHKFIDAGADLIIGSHPHVVQPIEKYKNKYIFYSLGNFVFDQYFSPETMKGLAVGVNLVANYDKLIVNYYLFPLDINSQTQTSQASPENYDEMIEFLADKSLVPDNIKQQIKQGVIFL